MFKDIAGRRLFRQKQAAKDDGLGRRPVGPFQRGEPAIVVAIRNQAPALMRLALDIGLVGLMLGIERVEFDLMK
jgi:hypothetical protein